MTHGKDWMVGASTCSVGKATPEVVRAYAEAGLDAMEISLKAHEYTALDLPALRRAADDVGLTIWSLHLPFSNDLSIAHKDAQVRKKAMETNIALLRKLGENGISHAVVHPGTEPTADADRTDQRRRAAVRGGAAAHLPRQLFRGDGLPLGGTPAPAPVLRHQPLAQGKP